MVCKRGPFAGAFRKTFFLTETHVVRTSDNAVSGCVTTIRKSEGENGRVGNGGFWAEKLGEKGVSPKVGPASLLVPLDFAKSRCVRRWVDPGAVTHGCKWRTGPFRPLRSLTQSRIDSLCARPHPKPKRKPKKKGLFSTLSYPNSFFPKFPQLLFFQISY